MNLSNFLALLARRKRILLLCMLIPAIIVAVSYWTVQSKNPEHTVTTTLTIGSDVQDGEDYADTIEAERIQSAYIVAATNSDVVLAVSNELSLDFSPTVTAQSGSELNLFELSVSHLDLISAEEVTDLIIDMLAAQSSRREDLRGATISISNQSRSVSQSTTAADWLRGLLLWILVGFLIGAVLAYLLDSIDPKLRSTMEIEQAAQLYTIAELPILKKNEPIVFLNGTSAQSEAYRSLRTIITNYGGNNPISTLLLTSAKSGEGKSTIAANLAIAMAQVGRKVLLVDCDMRKPAVHDILGIPNMVGVSNVLLKQTKAVDAIRHLPPFRIDVMTSGPPVNMAAELLNSSRMVRLVEELEVMYDIVIFDAPAILPVTDAVILSRFVSAVTLVVGKNQVEGREVEMARRQLRSVGVEPIGVIVNRVKPRESKYYR